MSHVEEAVIIRDFSSSGNSSEWELSENELKRIRIISISSHNFLIYANGNCEENNGYVSIICSETLGDAFKPLGFLVNIEFRYTFSVVDVSGNKRFTQTIVCIPGKTVPTDSTEDSKGNSHFGLDRYLKREILLNDPAELLPDDCLTIYVEIDYISLNYDKDFIFLQPPPVPTRTNSIVETTQLDYLIKFFTTDERYIGIKLSFVHQRSFSIGVCGRLRIPLETFYGRKLCSFSGFFQRASVTALTEGKTREVHIPDEEVVAFHNIMNILFKPFLGLYVNSIEDICQLYVIADKYEFQSVMETCRKLIKDFLSTTDDSGVREHVEQSMSDIIVLADEYRDSELKDILETYQEGKDIFGTDNYALGKYLKERLFPEWKCSSRVIGRNLSGDVYQLRFSSIPNSELEFYR